MVQGLPRPLGPFSALSFAAVLADVVAKVVEKSLKSNGIVLIMTAWIRKVIACDIM
jgi:hypothetical protein